MLGFCLKNKALSLCVLVISALFVSAQDVQMVEVMDEEPTPSIIKALPDSENMAPLAKIYKNPAEFKAALGNPAVLGEVAFETGAEGVIADYEAGRLAIIEYNTPQASIAADQLITAKIAELAQIGQPNGSHYRRIGNYNAFVFDAKSETAAAGLLDQVKYQKRVQWLSKDPYALKRAERYYVETTSDVVLSAVKVTGVILLIALTLGGLVGFWIFQQRSRRQRFTNVFSDAGGMVRLNLDDMTSPSTDRLLDTRQN